MVICLFLSCVSQVIAKNVSKIDVFLPFSADVSKLNMTIVNRCIWKIFSSAFRKWYGLWGYEHRFWRYWHLKCIKFPRFLLSQQFFECFLLFVYAISLKRLVIAPQTIPFSESTRKDLSNDFTDNGHICMYNLLTTVENGRKTSIFDTFLAITWEPHNKNRQATPFFSSSLHALSIGTIFFWI